MPQEKHKPEEIVAKLRQVDVLLSASEPDQTTVANQPRLLSDNGSSYISADLATRLDGNGMQHDRGVPYYRQTHDKI
jgi:putative transposase